jgi:hypothetical protein
MPIANLMLSLILKINYVTNLLYSHLCKINYERFSEIDECD